LSPSASSVLLFALVLYPSVPSPPTGTSATFLALPDLFASLYQTLSLLDLYLAFLSHGNEIAYAVQSETLIPLCMSHFSKYTPTLLHFNPSQLLYMSAA
jgi:hypothetical protein